MSVAHTTPAPIARRSSLLRWVTGGTLGATVLTVAAIAAWPASEADKAYDDGEKLGAAVAQLQVADSSAEVEAALADVQVAANESAAHGGEAVADQVAAQEDALTRAVDGFVGATTTSDDFEAELYEYELDVAVSDLSNNAEDFRSTGPDVQQAYWEGYEAGLDG